MTAVHELLPTATGRRSWQVLGGLIARTRGQSLLAVGTALAAGVLSVLAPIVLGRIVDVVVDGGTTRELGTLVAVLVAAALGGGVLTALATAQVEQLVLRWTAELREQVMDRSLTLDTQTLEAAGSGDLTARISTDVDAINMAVRQLSGVFMALLAVATTAVGFASLDWRLALAFLAVVLVYYPSLRWYLPTAARRYAAERVATGARSTAVLSSVEGVETVHAYGTEATHTAAIATASRGAIDAGRRAMRVMLHFSNSMNLAEAVGLASLLITGFFLVRGDLVTVGAVTAAALLFHRLFGPLGMLLFSVDDIQAAGAALARLVGVADLPSVRRRPAAPVNSPVGLSGQGIGHRYRTGDPVLFDVDVDVPAGTSLAVVGESGAGKTTLAAILGGTFAASSGDVRVAGVPIGDLDPSQLRRRIGVITQEVHTFIGPLRDDLRLAAPAAADEDLLAACRVVGAQGWVEALPQGLDTRVGEGGHRLTAAQAQQLALARILLVDPPVVIMDEATAEAGSSGARRLEESARAVLAGRTAVVVAHRLTQARQCDRIAVMAQGRVVEIGSHDELVAAAGPYARLWAAWQG